MTISDLDVIEKNLKLSLEADINEFNKQLDFYSDISMEGSWSDTYKSAKDKFSTAINVTADVAGAVKDTASAVWNSRFMGFIKESTKNNLYDVCYNHRCGLVMCRYRNYIIAHKNVA